MKSCNGTKQNFCARLRVYLGLALLFFCLGMSGQVAETSYISLSKERYALSDTINASIPVDVLSGTDCFVDLVSPFGEVIAQKRTSAGKVQIPILPTWECGFYELRVYRDATSPVLATRIVPILTDNTTDSIPMWEAVSSTMTTHPVWLRDFMASGNGNFQGLLLTKKGKALEKEGICVELQGMDKEGNLVWEGTAISGRHGEFSLSVPKDKVHGMTLFFKDNRGKRLAYNCVILPDVKEGVLSDVYQQECLQTARRLGLNVYDKSIDDRRYYFYDMRWEALNSYISAGRVPLLGDWFVSKKRFALAMKNEHRAVGWNARRFSMWPSKMFRIGEHRYRRHTLNAGGTSYAMHTPYATHTVNGGAGADFSSGTVGEEGAPRIGINNLSSVIVLSGHGLETLISPNMYRDYIKPYDPIMVYFE